MLTNNYYYFTYNELYTNHMLVISVSFKRWSSFMDHSNGVKDHVIGNRGKLF